MTPDRISDKSWADALIAPVTVAPAREPLMVSDVEGVSDAEYTATIKRLIHEQVGEGWESVREEAVEALKTNPDDETAKISLLKYQQWKLQQNLPAAIAKKTSGLVIERKFKNRLSTAKVGHWVKTNVGWAIRTSRNCAEDDVIPVKRKGGSEQMKLTEKLNGNTFRGTRVG